MKRHNLLVGAPAESFARIASGCCASMRKMRCSSANSALELVLPSLVDGDPSGLLFHMSIALKDLGCYVAMAGDAHRPRRRASHVARVVGSAWRSIVTAHKKSRSKERLSTLQSTHPQSSSNDKSRTAPLSADITSFA
ncbi:hypothetical protein CBA19CS11_38465 [Caballeronia novacaledonica]|uniref:hypothetical protein n=1 Tax=Caballeronia novacaledonica TaxID=1544861 RepID=UPI001EE2529E|nr:hypothetical protein [Caballeronia novacaledonica]GJH14853.1 hypothetical protein CBA19CS11_38465 [Caballeronia novacaledonica]